MSEAIICALITGAVTLIGTVLAVVQSGKKTEATMATNQAVMKTEIDELRREVREHNNFARRMPVVEEQISALDKRVTRVEAK